MRLLVNLSSHVDRVALSGRQPMQIKTRILRSNMHLCLARSSFNSKPVNWSTHKSPAWLGWDLSRWFPQAPWRSHNFCSFVYWSFFLRTPRTLRPTPYALHPTPYPTPYRLRDHPQHNSNEHYRLLIVRLSPQQKVVYRRASNEDWRRALTDYRTISLPLSADSFNPSFQRWSSNLDPREQKHKGTGRDNLEVKSKSMGNANTNSSPVVHFALAGGHAIINPWGPKSLASGKKKT